MSQSSQVDIDLAPIALFVYNRPDHTRLTVEALLENELSAQSDLFIYSDAARKPEDAQAVLSVRSYLSKIKGFKTVTIIERPVNFGLAKSIIDGVTSICERSGKVIVLEDDLITSRYFLGYMNNALVKYVAEEKIISVHGYCYPVINPLPEVFFLRGADCWGWATWKRGWDLFEHDANKLYSRLQASGEQRVFDFDGQYPYTEMLKQQIEGRVNSWAIRWYASAFLANRLTLYPGVSLVQNIGNDNSGTHKGNTDLFKGKIASRPVVLEDMAIVASDEGYKAFREYFYTLRPTLIQRLKIKAKKILNKWQAN